MITDLQLLEFALVVSVGVVAVCYMLWVFRDYPQQLAKQFAVCRICGQRLTDAFYRPIERQNKSPLDVREVDFFRNLFVEIHLLRHGTSLAKTTDLLEFVDWHEPRKDDKK